MKKEKVSALRLFAAALLLLSFMCGCSDEQTPTADDDTPVTAADKAQPEADSQTEPAPDNTNTSAEKSESDTPDTKLQLESEPEKTVEDSLSEPDSKDDFLDTYENDIVYYGMVALDQYVSNISVHAVPKYWTIANFDSDGAILAISDVTDKSTKVSQQAMIVFTPVMEEEKMENALLHFVSVGDVVYKNDGYCDEGFAILEEAFQAFYENE